MDFGIYALVNLIIFLIALLFHFRVKERGNINMLEKFDEYQKRQQHSADQIQDYFEPDKYQENLRRGQPVPKTNRYVDIFSNQSQSTRSSTANSNAPQTSKKKPGRNPALEQAFRELQSEFQQKRTRR